MKEKYEIAIKVLKMIRDSDSDASELAGKALDEIRRLGDEGMSEVQD